MGKDKDDVEVKETIEGATEETEEELSNNK